MDFFQGILNAASNILGAKSANIWKQIQNEPDNPGSSKVVDRLNKFYQAYSYKTQYDNTSEPIRLTKVTDNICKHNSLTS